MIGFVVLAEIEFMLHSVCWRQCELSSAGLLWRSLAWGCVRIGGLWTVDFESVQSASDVLSWFEIKKKNEALGTNHLIKVILNKLIWSTASPPCDVFNPLLCALIMFVHEITINRWQQSLKLLHLPAGPLLPDSLLISNSNTVTSILFSTFQLYTQ